MRYIEGQNRKQYSLLPDVIEDYIKEDNPVRVIDAFVDSLNLEKLGFSHTKRETGRPSYDPADMLKLYIYGYINKIRSSRKLMVECARNIELFYLIGKLIPDFRTISDYRKDNCDSIKEVFREFVRLCNNIGLYGKELYAIDGTKIRAVNSRDNAYNKEILSKKLSRIEKHIIEYFDMLEQNDKEDSSDQSKLSSEEIKNVIRNLAERKQKYEGFLNELDKTGKTQILTTDPDAKRMRTKDGFNCCYNIQVSVDSESHLIAEYEVTGKNNDSGELTNTAVKTKKTLEMNTIEVVADKGYDSKKDILQSIENAVIPNVALKNEKIQRVYTFPYEPKKLTDKILSSTKKSDILTCIKAGVLPNCYKESIMEIDLQENSTMSCFTRNEDGTVTCPQMKILKKRKRKGPKTIFKNHEACRECVNRCTSSGNHKELTISDGSDIVLVRVFGKNPGQLNPIPKGAKISPNNHSLDLKVADKSRVILKLNEDRDKIHKRMCTVEHPFGTIKWYGGAHYLLCRGKPKVSAEVGLSFLAYNMNRAIKMVGTTKLIEGIKAN